MKCKLKEASKKIMEEEDDHLLVKISNKLCQILSEIDSLWKEYEENNQDLFYLQSLHDDLSFNVSYSKKDETIITLTEYRKTIRQLDYVNKTMAELRVSQTDIKGRIERKTFERNHQFVYLNKRVKQLNVV